MSSTDDEQRISRTEGRGLFGLDVPGYDSIRPEYPAAVYERLQEVCGLASGTWTLEIGAGSGLATRELIALGANPLVAIEPDQALADQLRHVVNSTDARVDVHVASFEEFMLPDHTFDLAVAATSFHWVDPSVGLAKVRSVLRPAGAWAMWWNVFGDPDRDDPFHDATHGLMAPLHQSPSAGESGKPPYSLDTETRMGELSAPGFERIDHRLMRWSVVYGPDEIRALYGTFSSVNRLPGTEREDLLDALSEIAKNQFGGAVDRHMVTSMYTSFRPPLD